MATADDNLKIKKKFFESPNFEFTVIFMVRKKQFRLKGGSEHVILSMKFCIINPLVSNTVF